jgi:type I restriction enzyme S subunit
VCKRHIWWFTPPERLHQIYFWIEQNKDQIISVASGATYKEINRTEFREFLIAIPDQNTNERFIEMMIPIADQIENLQTKNAILRDSRDLLLPRLVSGQVDVSALEIAVPQV